MKRDKEDDILSSLQKERFNDLLKLYAIVRKKVYHLLNNDTAIEDILEMITQYTDIGNQIDIQIRQGLIAKQRKEMYAYTRKK